MRRLRALIAEAMLQVVVAVVWTMLTLLVGWGCERLGYPAGP